VSRWPCALLFACAALAAAPAERVLDDFRDLAPWQVSHTDDVAAAIAGASDATGAALRLDFDFRDARGRPVNGYATARRALALDVPENFELAFRVRGEAPVNDLQLKLIDPSGDNVWWLRRPDFEFSRDWRELRVPKRRIEFAWGPTADHTLRRIAAIEFVVSSGRDGGRGSVYFSHLVLRELPPPDAAPARPRLTASSALPGHPAAAAMDGDPATAWRSDPGRDRRPRLDIDLGGVRELSGLVLHWRHGERAAQSAVRRSRDGRHWQTDTIAVARSGDDEFIALGDTAARHLRLDFAADAAPIGLAEIELKDPDWAATRNAFYRHVAAASPRGRYPRGFVEQAYWTIVGVDGGEAPALLSEDGAIEPRRGGYSIEPFLVVDGRPLRWADVAATQALADGYLPMPSVTWQSDGIELDIEAFARGTRETAMLIARYRVRNRTDAPLALTLELAIRPFQVNPPAQFLGVPGGVSELRALRWDGERLRIDGDVLLPLDPPDDFEPRAVDGTPLASVSGAARRGVREVRDPSGQASGALRYDWRLPAHGEREVALVVPLAGAVARVELGRLAPAAWVERERAAVAAAWRARLERVRLVLPPAQRHLADALRTAQAQMLISRDGAALRPGTRAYARSWIRDGAMIAEALLRLGEVDAVRDYVDWYAPYQFASGKVPCCVDHRGADPVPENDSHGELIHAIAELYRHDGDRAALARRWPHVAAAIGYLDQLRASETGAANPAFRGLLPASISHEGYSAKPMHSYWDDFWALAGYRDAVELAEVLGHGEEARRIARSRDDFHRDLAASLALAVKTHGIDFLPGCAELGDFDPTSTTVALVPAAAEGMLPPAPLRNTFERYWREFAARAAGTRAWDDYTPYEWRNVGAFARLGWRQRAQQAIAFFFATGARPRAWHQWAEVVGRDPRAIRFIGDMPHAWIASDFVRAVLDLLAYERDADRALVLAAGVPVDWLDGDGVGIDGLRTQYGTLSYTLKQNGKSMILRIAAGAHPPGGFVVPWPYSTPPGAMHGARWQDGEVHVPAAPAEVTIERHAGADGGDDAR
jgi:hypothetical protein